jgi:hypothetical protein
MEEQTSTGQGTATSAVPKAKKKSTVKSKNQLKQEKLELKVKIKELEDKVAKMGAPNVQAKENKGVFFWTESDLTRDKNGNLRVASTYPMYFNKKQRDDILEEIRMYEHALNNPMGPELTKYISQGHEGEYRARLEKARTKLEAMEKMVPDFKRYEDDIHKMTLEAGELISESMPTRNQMHKGLILPHDECDRLTTDCIPVSDRIAAMAAANQIPFDHKSKKMSRTNLTRLWQIGRHCLGENVNSETLRRDG